MSRLIITGVLLTKKRNTMQIFPEKARELWNECELRALVLTSLVLQLILILIGNRRKHSASNKIRVLLWLAYLSADSVATVSLGVLSNNQEDSSKETNATDPNYVIAAFWAPFLLLHLGGPDTITAYSLEDNELWLRHFLGLIVQVGVAFYVFLRAWNSGTMSLLSIPIFVAGIVKFGERTWVLRSASSEHFRESMLPSPDPGPNYARYMEEYCAKKEEGFHVKSTIIDAGRAGDQEHPGTANTTAISVDSTAEIVRKAHRFFLVFRRLCADLILSYHDITGSRAFFRKISFDSAFKVIEFELGLMYDAFYTKAVLINSRVGIILRCISFFSTVSVLITFFFANKEAYLRVDVVISYILLVGAIVLEICAVIVMLASDWTVLRLSRHKSVNSMVNRIFPVSVRGRDKNKRRWSNKMAQYNLISICLENKPPKCINLQKVFFVDKLLEKYRHMYVRDVPTHLKELIFEQLKDKSSGDFENCKELCRRRGDHVLRTENLLNNVVLGRTTELEFDQSILLWHIATDLCYYSGDDHSNTGHIRGGATYNRGIDDHRKASKLLSDYMLYLVVVCPFMLPNGIGQIRFQDTCAEAAEFFKERVVHVKNKKDFDKEARRMLMEVSTEVPPLEVKGDRSKSVLFEACIVAKAVEESMGVEQRWKVLCRLWVEILSYAANRCGWSHHAQQLRRGGELLTHVWLLMAHLGITEQFQISRGHARAKLIVQ
ncbi:hypothetical protein L484_009581 [Morus notabilis]|uniref:DUF4220 domain-containing protein n=1 Tax=Morus notabilis TaxID=981085 RepID=W9QIV2_9ROSA|nr:uncharacterized protein LOC21392906 [Morus notabilis]EXB23820.1 hypothetical protein L484_009581 [Morus notabilis]